MKRREFIAFIGAAAAWPLTARAQAVPVIGFLSAVSETETSHLVNAFRRGLAETGFGEGKDVKIEYRFAEGQYDRLPAQAADLVDRQVNLIMASAPPAALAAKAATTTIPIVFIVGLDPVAAGLVDSFNRPGGNATGVSLQSAPLGQKRLELLHQLVPKTNTVAMLVNPFGQDTPLEIRDMQAAARATGIKITMLNASTQAELESTIDSLASRHVGALLVGADPFFMVKRKELVMLVARQGVPAVYPFREFTAAGGLLSYGTNIANSYRQAGIYCGRILKGAKPADLPVLNPTTFELVLNLSAARNLNIEIPPTLHARSDEVIE